jgi:hypothetical protein
VHEVLLVSLDQQRLGLELWALQEPMQLGIDLFNPTYVSPIDHEDDSFSLLVVLTPVRPDNPCPPRS